MRYEKLVLPIGGQDRLDPGHGHARVLELDLPLRAPGVVDRELETDRAIGERCQEDEQEPRDREEEREGVEPASPPDYVKHARGPLPVSWSGRSGARP